MSLLFSPFPLRGLTLRNRLVVSPMCMYSSRDGFANDFHLVHLGQFALGGAGLIVTEATAVSPEGRISPEDLGLWRDEHVTPLARATDFVHEHGGLIAVQLAHAGRKAGTFAPFRGRGVVPLEAGGWEPVGPSPIAFSDVFPTPRELTEEGIANVIADFVSAARRAILAGFDAVEIHAAHGYLLHQFLSPLSNLRTDAYGGPFENRVRLLVEVARAVREVWPMHLPLLVRISATDWVSGGWDNLDSVRLARLLLDEGVDLIDVSSGGLSPLQEIHVTPGYQVPFSTQIRAEAQIPTMAVGLIDEARQAESILSHGGADLIAVGREFLRDPHFPTRAARDLEESGPWAPQYARAAH